jgi:hypothetical protein
MTPDQIILAVAGSKYYIPGNMNGTIPIPEEAKKEKVVNHDTSRSNIIKNML